MSRLIIQFIWLQISFNLNLSIKDAKYVVRNSALRIKSGDKSIEDYDHSLRKILTFYQTNSSALEC